MARSQKGYFKESGTVSQWWEPDDDTGIFAPLLRQQNEVLRSLDVRGKRVFDAGAGKGRFTIQFAKEGAEMVLAGDISREMLRILRQRADEAGVVHLVEPLVMDIDNLPIRQGVLDMACCMETIVHLPDPAKTIVCLAGTLGPGGDLVVSTTAPVRWIRYLPWVKTFKQLFEWMFTPIYTSRAYDVFSVRMLRRAGTVGRPIPPATVTSAMKEAGAPVWKTVPLGVRGSPRIVVSFSKTPRRPQGNGPK